MRSQDPGPRWPDGPLVAIVLLDDVIGLSHCRTVDGEAVTEAFGALHGRVDAFALADRLRQLQPSSAMVVPHGSRDADQYEQGMLVGSVVALVAALGIGMEWAPLPPAAVTRHGTVIH